MGNSSNWGLCIMCMWGQIDPDATLASTTHGLCIEQSLQPYLRRVAGGCGWGLFVAGHPARAAGSGACPPTAKPMR
ncbi:MAG: hypothetical protein K0M46_10180 [Thiobacillus sp.]|nr:hypothetical protein [Thiobacillus sp.]